jgi:glucose-1-phosphate thymidylyltransferase
VEAGITDITFIISPETGDEVRAAVGDGSGFGASAKYVKQLEPRGIADGIRCARESIGEAPFVTFLGDNFLTDGIVPYVREFAASRAQAGVLLKHVPDARSFGVAEFDGERLVRVVEKPAAPASDLALIGIYMFRNGVFDAISRTAPSARGELEVTDAIQRLLDDGAEVRADVVTGEWIDTGKHDDLLAANRLILERVQHDISGGSVDDASTLHGRVVLQEGSRVVNSVISGPAIIGARTVIENAYIGPFTSIGPDCRVAGSEIAGSVVMDHSTIEQIPGRIEHSLIGRNVELRAGERKPRSYEMVLGDFSKLQVP